MPTNSQRLALIKSKIDEAKYDAAFKLLTEQNDSGRNIGHSILNPSVSPIYHSLEGGGTSYVDIKHYFALLDSLVKKGQKHWVIWFLRDVRPSHSRAAPFEVYVTVAPPAVSAYLDLLNLLVENGEADSVMHLLKRHDGLYDRAFLSWLIYECPFFEVRTPLLILIGSLLKSGQEGALDLVTKVLQVRVCKDRGDLEMTKACARILGFLMERLADNQRAVFKLLTEKLPVISTHDWTLAHLLADSQDPEMTEILLKILNFFSAEGDVATLNALLSQRAVSKTIKKFDFRVNHLLALHAKDKKSFLINYLHLTKILAIPAQLDLFNAKDSDGETIWTRCYAAEPDFVIFMVRQLIEDKDYNAWDLSTLALLPDFKEKLLELLQAESVPKLFQAYDAFCALRVEGSGLYRIFHTARGLTNIAPDENKAGSALNKLKLGFISLVGETEATKLLSLPPEACAALNLEAFKRRLPALSSVSEKPAPTETDISAGIKVSAGAGSDNPKSVAKDEPVKGSEDFDPSLPYPHRGL